jgi:hypothetical protein
MKTLLLTLVALLLTALPASAGVYIAWVTNLQGATVGSFFISSIDGDLAGLSGLTVKDATSGAILNFQGHVPPFVLFGNEPRTPFFVPFNPAGYEASAPEWGPCPQFPASCPVVGRLVGPFNISAQFKYTTGVLLPVTAGQKIQILRGGVQIGAFTVQAQQLSGGRVALHGVCGGFGKAPCQ